MRTHIKLFLILMICFPALADARGIRSRGYEKRIERESSRKSSAPREVQKEALEQNVLNAAKVAFLSQSYKDAADLFRKFLRRYPKSGLSDEAYYWLGQSYVELGDKPNALLCFDRLVYQSDIQSPYRYYGLWGKAVVYEKIGPKEEAVKYYERLAEHPALSWGHLPLEKLIDYYRAAGNTGKVRLYRKELSDRYPLSEQAESEPVALARPAPSYYSVQVGAFGNEQNANKLKSKLGEKGYSVFVVEEGIGATLRYKVRVGHFAKEDEAKKFLGRFERQERLKATVVPGA